MLPADVNRSRAWLEAESDGGCDLKSTQTHLRQWQTKKRDKKKLLQQSKSANAEK